MTDKTTTATATITVAAHDLVRALKAIAPFVSSDDTLKMIHGIQIRPRNGVLQLSATDSFVAAVTTVGGTFTSTGTSDPLDVVFLPSLVRKQIVDTWGRASAKYPLNLTITVEADDNGQLVTVRDQVGMAHALPVDALKSPLPDIEKLITNNAEGTSPEGSGVVAVNMENLTKVKSLVRRGDRAEFQWPEAPSRPLLVTVGDHSVAIVMPMRLPNGPTPVETILAGGAR